MQQELTLREKIRRYEAVLNSHVDGVIIITTEFQTLWANGTIIDLYGNAEEMYKRKCYNFFYGRNEPCINCPSVEVFADKKPHRRIQHVIDQDNRSRWRDVRANPYYDKNNNILGSIEFISDHTKQKKIEVALRESEQKYRTILKSIEDGYYEVDNPGSFTFFNDSMCIILGYSKDELMGMNYRQFMDEERAKNAFQTFNEVHGTGKPTKVVDWELIRKDGSVCSVEISISPIKNSKGEPTGFRGIARDVTERKVAEEEKRKLEAQLQNAKKMRAIGTLAGGVAHDLNNILSGLVSYPELLLMDISEDSPLRNPILTIKKSGEKAAAIVQDLLTLARRGVAVTEVVNLNNIISEYLKSPEYEKLKFYHPKIQLETDLETGLLNISGSPVHLSKTIMNLVSNAAEAMPTGGSISMSAKNRYIDKPIRGYDHVAEGDYVILSISDTGVGISPEDMERIFEPFYTKKVMGRSGTGLGMAVVWGTVKDHKGYIDVQSIEGKGTTFTLYFPVTREEAVRDKSSISIEDYIGKGESILVVDDVEEQREIASGMLKKLGYSVTAVSSGEEAVEYMKGKSIDILVLDMIMDPGIDGLETYKRILEFHPKQKAIIASGFSETGRVKETLRLGAGVYVKKPYVLEKIGIAVRTELDYAGFSKPPSMEKNNAMISA
ncbi:MAG: PAS domain S-box protein [Pseudomonadota bacterium]